MKNYRQTLSGHQTMLAQEKAALEEAKDELKKLNDELDDLKKQLNKANSDLNDANKEKATKELRFNSTQSNFWADPTDANRQIMISAQNDYNVASKRVDDLIKKVADLEKDIKELEDVKIPDATQKLNQAQQLVDDREARIAETQANIEYGEQALSFYSQNYAPVPAQTNQGYSPTKSIPAVK